MKRRRTPATSERRYRGQSVGQLRSNRRERLLEVAYSMVANQGYASLSIDRVCAAARVATRHFYEHFSGKEALLHVLFERISTEMLDTVARALMLQEMDIAERVTSAVREAVRYALSDPRRARILCLESVGISPDMEAQRRVFIRRFASLIDQAAQQLVADGTLLPGNYLLSGVALVGATQGLMADWLTGDTGLTVEHMEHNVVGFYRSLVKGAKQFAIERNAEAKAAAPARGKAAGADRRSNR